MYPRTIIDSLPAVPNRDQLTHKDLHAHFSTGQSILLSGSGRDKKYGYRNGIQTDLGDIRNDVWRDLVRELIVGATKKTCSINSWSGRRSTPIG